MIPFIFTYFFSYFLTYSGFLLGRATVEEHLEIKKYVDIIKEILLIITYLSLFYIFSNNAIYLFIFALLIVLKIYTHYNKNLFSDIHDVALFGISLVLFHKNLYIDEIYFTVLPIIILIFDNSYHKFHIKREGFKLLIAAIILVLFNI